MPIPRSITSNVQEEDGANQLVLTGDTATGYAAAVTITLPITATYDAMAPFGGGTDSGELD